MAKAAEKNKNSGKNSGTDIKKPNKGIENLTPFKPGESGNPNGRPLGKRNKDTLFNLAIESLAEKYVEDHNLDPLNKKNQIKLEDVDIEADIFRQFVNSARNGNFKAIIGFMEHRHGKANQTLIHTGDENNPVIVEERKKKKRAEVERIMKAWTQEEEQ